MASDISVTFKLNSTSPKHPHSRSSQPLSKRVTKLDACPSGTQLLSSTDDGKSGFDIYGQGLIGALYLAYSNHLNLILSPDDLWLTILISLNNYMRAHAEDMRSVFVAHEGKAQLIIETGGAFADQNWPVLLDGFEKKISENITSGMAEVLMPNFSTTTPHLRSVAQIFLMGVMKDYFSYGVMTMCGIPAVTMRGTLADWQKLKSKIQFLRTLSSNLDPWVTILEPIMDQLIKSYEGSPNVEWWNSIIDYMGGSGHNDITGWTLAFFPFHDGRWQLKPVDTILETGKYGSIDVGTVATYRSVHVPVKYNEFGKMYDVLLYAESYRVDFDESTSTVSPSFDYAILLLPDGTITEPYDWNDRSVKTVTRRYSKRHPHQLTHFTVPGCSSHYCDICGDRILRESYACRMCDFDACLTCIDWESL
jgi:hypothetical protein